MRHPAIALPAFALAAATLTACQADRATGPGTDIAIKATDTACEVSASSVPAGTHTFAVTNKGSKVTEMYVYGAGDRIVTERENIGPGTSAKVTVTLDEGRYQIACKPGQRGDGIRQALAVTAGSSASAAPDGRLGQAVAAYRTYVEGQVALTQARTRSFAAAVTSGNVALAKSRYAPSREGWERIEPVAESFGDVDPKVDLREADLEAGQDWTGWHRIEKALWMQGTTRGMARYADKLLAELETLRSRLPSVEITPTSMANGAKELLDEVATGKITGEEEIFSHTDLVDFAANVDGAQQVFRLLKPVAVAHEPKLAAQLTQSFDRLQTLLRSYRTKTGYVSYDTVTPVQRKALSDAVNALSEPLSHLTAAVVAR